ncbi:MAG: hypothetical protein AAGC79_06895 [Pseudomonadota bacterium]
MTLKSIASALFALGLCLCIGQGIILVKSVAVIDATLMYGAPEPQDLDSLSEFEPILKLFG